ncbi:MAG TPA: hypothetical protein VMT03_10070 [Polyangia bacterium]|nr:hypothetical protein [Polyangia bacterium]
MALAAASCQNMPEVVGGEGKVVLALVIPGGTTISSVSWVVSSSTSQQLAAGTTNTSRTGATASFVVGVPASTGDTVTMSAVTSAGITCAGTSSSFDVAANQTKAVSVNLNCAASVPDGGLGSLVVTGTVVAGDSCPTLTAWMLSPQTAAANGGQIDVSVVAADADSGDTLSYSWSAGAGTFADSTAAATTYSCGASGNQTLQVSVSDNHTPTPCTINISFPSVSCN